MMKQRISIFLLFTLLLFANGYAQKGIMRLTQQTLMPCDLTNVRLYRSRQFQSYLRVKI